MSQFRLHSAAYRTAQPMNIGLDSRCFAPAFESKRGTWQRTVEISTGGGEG